MNRPRHSWVAQRYDRLLIRLSLAAPLCLILLSGWQTSLQSWYQAADTQTAPGFSKGFVQDAEQWLASDADAQAALILIVDDQCPCTKATRLKLESAIAASARPDASLRVVRVDPHTAARDENLSRLLTAIPSTPTLLASEQGRLLYAGPVNSGDFCTTAVNEILGLAALQRQQAGFTQSWLSRGCYCPMPEFAT